ncbi:MAG: hypothetical protein MJY50_05495 [Bacteroidales bacterium]|nr:hypothetical protein [Bacteroidales bacterium]
MSKILKVLAALGVVLAFASCNKMTPEQMAAKAGQVTVNCTPGVLTYINGKVPVELEVTYPEGYFYPEVVLTVTPVLVYEGGEAEGLPWVFQGEKVKENNVLVHTDGGTFRHRLSFDYREGMEVSHLELRASAFFNGNTIAFPVRKVADGVIMTGQFALLDGFCSYKADNYQDVLHKTAEGQIMYRVNSSAIGKKQLKSESIEDYQDAIESIKQDDRYTIKGTQIVSYASPEGGKTLNDKLSGKRSVAAEKAWDTVGKGMEAESLEIKSIGQDWDGFREAVEKSDIPDKDLILRVLSMYSDPSVRESEIRNLSQIYTELKADVFPELRRSRFITNLDFRNYSIEDLEILSRQKIYMLDEEGLLKLASVTDNDARKEFIYNFAYEKFGSSRAGFNLAVMSFKAGKTGAAEKYLDRLNEEDDPEVINLRGLIEMNRQNWYKSEDLFEKAATELSRSNIGVVNMLQGNYDKAASVLSDDDPNKAVACLLAGNVAGAATCLKGDDARTDYLRAVVAARQGNRDETARWLASAIGKDPTLAEREKKDMEFAKLR